MISDEYQIKAAHMMQSAASEMSKAAGEVQEAARQLQFLLADGYGGNGVLLLEALRNAAPPPAGEEWVPCSEPAQGMPSFEVLDDIKGLVYGLRDGQWYTMRLPPLPKRGA